MVNLKKLPSKQIVTYRFLALFFFTLVHFMLLGQEKKDEKRPLERIEFDLRARNYFMATINKGNATDYYADVSALRGSISTHISDRLVLNIGGIASYRLFSNDLSKIDPAAGKSSRFERQLTGFIDPMEKNLLLSSDLLNITYKSEQLKIIIGRFRYSSPFLNPMDGRIKPSAVQGVHVDWTANDKLSLGGSFMNRFSTWGVETFKSTGDIIGHFGNGVDENGNPLSYRGLISSDGLLVGFMRYNLNMNIKLQLWNYALLGVNNSSNLRLDFKKNNILWGIAGLVQRPLNDDINAFYYRPDEKTNALSLRFGYKLSNIEAQINYTRIGEKGRYIIPREFGIEGFYTFLPRMRIEGYGDAHIVVGSLKYAESAYFSAFVGYGINILPSSDNFSDNKLGLDDYHQLMLDFRLKDKNTRWDTRFLFITTNTGGRTELPENSLNKYFFSHFNLVFNYYIL